jgi:ribosomal protein S16
MSVKKAQGENPRDGHLLSLSGVYMPQTNPEKSRVPLAVTQYLKDYSGITEAVLHFDGDRTGRMMSEAMRHILPAVGLSVTDEPPPQGKDYNDYLQAIQKRAYESEIDER